MRSHPLYLAFRANAAPFLCAHSLPHALINAAIYRAKYGESESIANLIPFMLGAFLESDKGFAKARKELPLQAPSEVAVQRNQHGSSQSRSTPSQEA